MSVKKKLQESSGNESYSYVGRREAPAEESLVTLKSNYAKDKVVSIGGMDVKFNSEGEAKIPRHHVPAVRKHMRVRPGRFRIIEKTAPAPAEPQPRVESLSKAKVEVHTPPKAKTVAKVPTVSDKPKSAEVAKAEPAMTVKVAKKEVTKKPSPTKVEEKKD